MTLDKQIQTDTAYRDQSVARTLATLPKQFLPEFPQKKRLERRITEKRLKKEKPEQVFGYSLDEIRSLPQRLRYTIQAKARWAEEHPEAGLELSSHLRERVNSALEQSRKISEVPAYKHIGEELKLDADVQPEFSAEERAVLDQAGIRTAMTARVLYNATNGELLGDLRQILEGEYNIHTNRGTIEQDLTVVPAFRDNDGKGAWNPQLAVDAYLALLVGNLDYRGAVEMADFMGINLSENTAEIPCPTFLSGLSEFAPVGDEIQELEPLVYRLHGDLTPSVNGVAQVRPSDRKPRMGFVDGRSSHQDEHDATQAENVVAYRH